MPTPDSQPLEVPAPVLSDEQSVARSLLAGGIPAGGKCGLAVLLDLAGLWPAADEPVGLPEVSADGRG